MTRKHFVYIFTASILSYPLFFHAINADAKPLPPIDASQFRSTLAKNGDTELSQLSDFFYDFNTFDINSAEQALSKLYQSAAKARDPLSKFYYAQEISRIERRFRPLGGEGEPAPLKYATFATNWRKTFGCINQWGVVGPFDNSSNIAMHSALPPQSEQKPPYDGKYQPVTWRTINGANNYQCSTRLSNYYPTDSSAFITRTLLEAKKAEKGLLLIGASGEYDLWVNGTYIGHQDKIYAYLPDAQVWKVNLVKGENSITLKLANNPERPLSFTVRLLDAHTLKPAKTLESSPITDFAVDQLSQHKLSQPNDDARKKNITPYGWDQRIQSFLSQIGRKKVSPTSRVKIAAFLQRNGYDSPQEPWVSLVDGVASDPNATPLDLAYASRIADKPWRQKELINQAVQRLSDKKYKDDKHQRYLVLTQKGKILTESKLTLDRLNGRRLLEDLVKEFPTAKSARYILADYYFDNDLPALARDLFTSSELFSQPTFREQKYLRNIASTTGQETVLRSLEANDNNTQPLTYKALSDYVTAKAASHEYDDALARIDAYRKNFPDSASADLLKANMLEAAGRVNEAIELLGETIRIHTGEAWVNDAYANILMRHNRQGEAIEVLENSLQYHPQNESLRRRIASLKPSSLPFYATFAVNDLPTFSKAHPPKEFPSDILVDQSIIYVSPNGLTRTYRQSVLRANTLEGVREASAIPIGYQLGDEQVDVISVKVYKSNGVVSEEFHKRWSNQTRKDISTYNDIGYLYLIVDNVEPGDVVEFQWTVSEIANDNFRGDYFGDVAFLQTDKPIVYERYGVLVPQNFNLYFKYPKLPFMKLDESFDAYLKTLAKNDAKEQKNSDADIVKEQLANEQLKDYKLTLFELNDIAEVISEPNTVGASNRYDYIVVSNKASWDDVGRWWWELVKDQLVTDDAISKMVDSLTKGLKTDDEKIAAIHDYVVKNTRYLHVGLGIHGWKPYRTSDIFQNRYGDCKDKASLLKVMLDKAGIPTDLVLVRTNNLGKVDHQPASMNIFNHAIAYIPSKNLFLDGTAEFNGVHELTGMDQGAQALIVKNGGDTKFLELPIDQPEQNKYVITLDVHLRKEKDSEVTGTLIGTGNNASYLRERLQDKKRRKNTFESLLSSTYNGLSIQNATYSTLTNLNQPVEISFSGKSDNLLINNGVSESIYAKGTQTNYAKMFTPTATRKGDVRLGTPYIAETSITWTPPTHFKFAPTPKDFSISSPYGEASVTYLRSPSDNRLTTKTSFKIKKITLPKDQYDAFRKFLLEVDKAFNTPISLIPENEK